MLARLGLCAVLGCLCTAPAALAGWSSPVPLTGCARPLSTAAPLVVFPSSTPQVRSGPGALLWTARSGCSDGPAEAFAAALGPEGLPGSGGALAPGTAVLGDVAAAVGTGGGQVIALGGAQAAQASGGTLPGAAPAAGEGALAEGKATGAFAATQALEGPATPLASASGYLGDTAILSTTLRRAPAKHGHAGKATREAARPRWELALRIQRHYASIPASALLLPVGASRPVAVAVAMDYRSDVLVVWASGGGIYAREVRQTGALEPVRRLASTQGAPELRALISDDDRAIVVWREQVAAAGGASASRVEASVSGASLSFGRAALVERFVDPPGLAPRPGSLWLTRLSSEAVMVAWTGMRAGRYVVCASPVSLRRGVWAPVTVSGGAPGAAGARRGATDAMLAGLVAGPRAEVLALWTVAPRLGDGTRDARAQAIAAAWGHYGGHGEARFAAPEAVAAPGPNGTPAAAFDPQTDAALAAWVRVAGVPRVVYSQRAAGPPPSVSVPAVLAAPSALVLRALPWAA
jgi:hypothetical protein